ncbi:protein-export chaperone SecB [Oleisolibacter albus]|uniref:protein-export chaperone SecB n=1 Tax=Oleisolibacter albus TaxID=2171757 RepID=UPI000DF2304B|nr:protein-export chaperone SecB [Oleisolibacter albus]
MTDETASNGDSTTEAGNRLSTPLVINAQYVKDLSFENPNAPQSLMGDAGAPKIDLQVDLQGRPLAENVFELALTLRAEATQGDRSAFICELVYGGVFTLAPLPVDQQRALLMIEGARMLFPFARQILADMTQQGGFPPLMLQPIDFVDLYRRQILAQQGPSADQPAQGNA